MDLVKAFYHLNRLLIVFFSRLPQTHNALAMRDEKHNILVIVKSCNMFSLTLVCSFLWYVCSFPAT